MSPITYGPEDDKYPPGKLQPRKPNWRRWMAVAMIMLGVALLIWAYLQTRLP